MQFLLKLSRAIDSLNRWCGRTVMWLVLIVVLISSSNAISRKFFDMSSNAWLEAQWYLFGALFLLTGGYTFLRNEHVRVDVLAARLSERKQIVIEIVGVLLFMLPACLAIMVLSWPVFMDSYVTHELSSNSGGLIRWPAKLIIPVGFALISLQGVSHLIKCIGFLRGLCPNPNKKLLDKSPEELLAEDIARQAQAKFEQQQKG
ncbi:TRAP transporter small permease subunit [Alcaligenes sp. SDU_A2]|uniref:TRAP transporter small permease subunit n=1 Tax=Alcaligenes sp. SDU_A2 TaxID=3136634 RepID=UPI002C544878|nr:TRAP transporter small permease subunit [Alcaligenes sp.]HRL26683.1 TRAP transporter small permease subunit [Alcaligenes sp.]